MTKLLLLGCGKMGSALLAGIRKKYSDWQIDIIEPSKEQHLELENNYSVKCYENISSLNKGIAYDMVLLAVKPQVMQDVVSNLKETLNIKNSLILSIAAGKKLEFFEGILDKNQAIIRTMPNLPVTVGMGTVACVANNAVNNTQKENTIKLFESVGICTWLEDEAQMDSLTAISGSGPAYLFNFAEALIDSAKKLNLPDDIARQIALQTIYGSAKLLEESGGKATELRIQVTSPKGTTEAALNVLMNAKDGLTPLVNKATKAACDRSKEL